MKDCMLKILIGFRHAEEQQKGLEEKQKWSYCKNDDGTKLFNAWLELSCFSATNFLLLRIAASSINVKSVLDKLVGR